MIVINEQSVFPDAIDPHIFFADADLENHSLLSAYYALLDAQDYTGASEYLESLQNESGGTVTSPISYYGAWLLNLYENALYAIESNMSQFVPENSKPKLVFHGSSAPTDPEFKHWVYCGLNPGIPSPPAPSTPDWWFNSPGVCPIDADGWQPELDSFGWNGYYELTNTNEGSTNTGIDAPEIQTAAEAQIQIPLYDANGNATAYTLRNIVSEEIGDIFEGDIGWALYNGDTLVEDWSMHLDWYYQTLDGIYLCCGADTMNYTDVRRGTSGTRHDVIYVCLIVKGSAFGSNSVSYKGNAIEMSQLSSRSLYLGPDWYT